MQEKKGRKTYCPVPEEQRPLNEYVTFKTSFFFSLPTLSSVLYIQNLGKIAFFTSLISLPISNFFYSAFEFSEKFIFINFLIIFVGQIFLLLRLYIGWYYIKERLSKASIEYEESGWYDGQIWVKPKKILKQDRLICYYKVFPILNRLEKTIIYLFIVFNLIFLITILI